MQVIIDSPGIKLSEHLQQLIQSKTTHLARLNERIITCKAVLKREKNCNNQDSFMEVRLTLPGKILFAREQSETFEIALDRVIDDLESQLHRYKSKMG